MSSSGPGAAADGSGRPGPAAGRGQRDSRVELPRLSPPAYPLAVLEPVPTWHGTGLSGRPLDLLAVLAGRQDASDQEIIEALWPENAPAHPLRALHVVVSRTRALTGEDVIERVGRGYRLALPASDIDARDLAARTEQAHICAQAGQWSRVLELTAGLPRPPEAGDQVSGPLAQLLGRAAAHANTARRDRALALEAAGEYEQAVPMLRAAADGDPGDEAVLAALMRAEAWVRSPATALEIYEDYRLRLREQGAVPGPAMRAAHEAALASESPVRRGLEPAPEHFLGREEDVTAVLKALSTRQLVTITGPGGVGKTTLAQAVAARSRRPAVYVAALADVAPGADLIRVLLDALGSPPVAEADSRRSLGAALASPGTFLVLDNCEHVAEEVADLIGPFLASCTGLRVLATSRRPLDLGAEHVHRLQPLDHASSAGLFRARALAARPGQMIDEADLELLLDRLEGIPLAIELAAARTRTLSAGQILARLPGRPDLLTGARNAPARQRTLTAVIQWSWNLLDAAERRGLARLAVLADGFTLAAAEALIGVGAADILDALVAHSLLSVRDHGVPRFHMLVTVRDFALAQLADSGDEAETAGRLRDWVLDMCSEIRLSSGAHSFGDAGGPQAERQNRLFQQLRDDEAVVIQVLEHVLQEVRETGAGPGSTDPQDDACLIGAALMRLWSVTWSYDRVADYAPRLIELAARPARSLRGNEARLTFMALYASLSGLLGPLPERIGKELPRSFDGEDPSMARVRRFLRAPAGHWPDLVHDADPWVAWIAGRCLSAQLENAGMSEAALDIVENLLNRLREADLAGIYLLELSSSRLQVLMTLGRYEQVADECTRALELVDRLLPAWGVSYRKALELDRAYCQAYISPRNDLASALLAATDVSSLPGTLRFVARSVSGELELIQGRARRAALIQRESLRYAGRWRSIMGAGSPWELYILGMCLVTDVELDEAEAAELDAPDIRARAVRLLCDMLTDPAPQQRDVPTIMALTAAVGLSTMVAAAPGTTQPATGAELVATALTVGTNQTCRLLSHDYLRDRARTADARLFADAETRVRHLDRARLLTHAAGLARRLANEAG
ncbi:BTAD domain-containing putative transcriptional regulator [Actinomyces massiliensis]|uniref:BTAD domain-containing putative transcriptional regulator n=1 Tax=Actinomyces massiliensis TaxID=461393 RepID=UPI0028EA7D70|nr:BTAD domain-containing putative transcriptional regulator [Actinomyces massiliensis]